mmetsp:Transcript_12258/g.34192  ORF Transcript_12258/g.34192 Transcript_12258/m.34192 type:complete len:288 (+) Transcript_12258:1-864(+)
MGIRLRLWAQNATAPSTPPRCHGLREVLLRRREALGEAAEHGGRLAGRKAHRVPPDVAERVDQEYHGQLLVVEVQRSLVLRLPLAPVHERRPDLLLLHLAPQLELRQHVGPAIPPPFLVVQLEDLGVFQSAELVADLVEPLPQPCPQPAQGLTREDEHQRSLFLQAREEREPPHPDLLIRVSCLEHRVHVHVQREAIGGLPGHEHPRPVVRGNLPLLVGRQLDLATVVRGRRRRPVGGGQACGRGERLRLGDQGVHQQRRCRLRGLRQRRVHRERAAHVRQDIAPHG